MNAAPPDPAPADLPPPPSRARQLLRRVSKVVFLIGVAGVVIYTLHSRPVAIEVSFELGSARRGLTAARMAYLAADGEEVSRVSFDYAATPPGVTQLHLVQLLRGDYRVAIELRYRRGEVPPSLGHARRERRPDGLERVRIERPLHVRGKGAATIFVVGD